MTGERWGERLTDQQVVDVAENPGGGWPPDWVGALAEEVIARRVAELPVADEFGYDPFRSPEEFERD